MLQLHGDYDYDRHGGGYAAYRQPDPQIAALIHAALGPARTVLNVGAGAGSYEPVDRHVIAIEPSAIMRRQRPAWLSPAIRGWAHALPLDDQSVDAAMAMNTVHQWVEPAAGLAELRRVTRGPIMIMTFDPARLHRFWLADYVPEFLDADAGRFRPIDEIAAEVSMPGAPARVEVIRIPRDCRDGFTEAYFARPEKFLEPAARQAQSAWRFLPAGVEDRFVAKLEADLRSGAWDERYGEYRRREFYEGALTLIVGGRRGEPA